MNFNHLEYAIAVAKYGSISKAAQNLFMSQPYLSGLITGLEKELGYQIFERSRSGIELTPQGEQFVKSAKLILLELKKIKGLGTKEEKQLNISCYYATYIMEMFLKFHKESSFMLPDRIKEMGNQEVMESVIAGESTLGIVFFSFEKKEKYVKLAEEMGLCMKELFPPMQMFVMAAKEHPLAGRSSISIEELRQYPYVCYDDSSSRKFLKILGMEEHSQLLEVSDRGGLYDAITYGGYLSVIAFRNEPKLEGMVLIPVSDKKLYLNSAYVTAKNYQMSRREKEFLKYIREGKE